MKAEKVRELPIDEINSKLKELRKELMKLRFQSTTGQVKNPVKKRWIRRDIARMLTIIKEKQNAG